MIDAEREVGAVWELWTPKAGQRVRIRRSAECPHRDDFLHAESEPDGSEGLVWCSFPSMFGEEPRGGHNVMVAFGSDDEGRTVSGGWFAAIELEQIS